MKIVINTCFGGFGLSQEAYKRLIELGVPVRKYIDQKQDPVTKLWLPEPLNDGTVIFNRMKMSKKYISDPRNIYEKRQIEKKNYYWDSCFREDRTNPLLVKVVEELGEKASDRLSKLMVVEIPDDVKWELDDYDGVETIHEVHRSWS